MPNAPTAASHFFCSTAIIVNTVELTAQPTVIAQQTNEDGSISIVRNGKFLSARNESDAFWFVGTPRAWEKFFLSKMNLVDADNISTLKTFHGTTVMLDETSRLCHKNFVDRQQSDRVIHARTSEKAINLFVLVNNAVKFIRSIGSDCKVVITDKPGEFKYDTSSSPSIFAGKLGEKSSTVASLANLAEGYDNFKIGFKFTK